MKILLLLAICAFGSSAIAQQHNYLIHSKKSGEDAFIRDASVTQDNGLICAIDQAIGKKTTAAITKFDEKGQVQWSKKLVASLPEGVETRSHSYDVFEHTNGNFYLHGIVKDEFNQRAFVLEVSPEGTLTNSVNFDLGVSYYYAINKMEVLKDGNFLLFFSHKNATTIVKLSPSGKIIWGKSLTRKIHATGKSPGYDFEVLESGDIIACGKNGYHFSLLKLSAKGELLWDKNIELGEFSEAKSLRVLDDGNVVLTGDYLPTNGSFTAFLMEVSGKDGTPYWAKQLDQFDGTFHYQQVELIDEEIHISLMGNNDPSMMDPEFQNYYVRLDRYGDVIAAYRNGEHYDLADYQRIVRMNGHNMIYGSIINEKGSVSGMVHTYGEHALDPCYWNELQVTTSVLNDGATVTEGVFSTGEVSPGESVNIRLVDFAIQSEGTCRPVLDESTENEENNALEAGVAQENKSMLSKNEFVVYPNPNDGVFHIRTSYTGIDAVVIDLSGKIVFQGRIEDGDSIDLRHEESGVYLLRITSDGETMTKRVVVR